MIWQSLIPQVGKDYKGPRWPFYFLVLVAATSTVRSLIHLLAPDGGASSIAGLAVNVEGGSNIVAMFAQWGASQLILALFYWLAILRYRFLTPLMLGVVFVEQVLRIGAGLLKPVEVAAAPPGEIGSYLMLPLALVMVVWSLRGEPTLNKDTRSRH